MVRLLLALLMLTPAAAHAARPFVTDDARIVEPGGWQLETFVKRQRRFDETEFWFLPAHNPWQRVELTLGYIAVNSAEHGDTQTALAQAKTLLKPLETNGAGFALTAGIGRLRPFQGPSVSNPYFNAIGSLSLAEDRIVLHSNLGAIHDRSANLTRPTWGLGAEILLAAPRYYAIVETYGQRGEKPALHTGLRIWLQPNRIQVDCTVGQQHATPERVFGSLGLRLLW